MPSKPAIMMKIAITQAKIGLSIKNLAISHPYCAAEAEAGAEAV